MKFTAKKKTGILVTGGFLALAVALTGCGDGGKPDATASPTGTYSSESANPIPQLIMGIDPASVPIGEDVKKKFGPRADTLASFALRFTEASTGIPSFQDPTRVAGPEDAKLLIPFKEMMTDEAYANLTTQLSQDELKLIPSTNTNRATETVDDKKYTQQGKEFGFNYGDIKFAPIQGANGGGVMMTQEVKITVPTVEGNVLTMTDQRQVVIEPGTADNDWKIATWRVTRNVSAS